MPSAVRSSSPLIRPRSATSSCARWPCAAATDGGNRPSPACGDGQPRRDESCAAATDGRARIGGVMGNLQTTPALDRPGLLAEPVTEALRAWSESAGVLVAEIDPTLADTAAFCDAYGVGAEESANCVVVSGKREGEVRYAA